MRQKSQFWGSIKQRLTKIAFDQAQVVWQEYWHQTGVFQVPKKDVPVDPSESVAQLRRLGYAENDVCVKAYGAQDWQGIWFANGGWVDLQQICSDEQKQLSSSQLKCSTTVSKIYFRNQQWHILDCNDELICTSDRIFLAAALATNNLLNSFSVDLFLKFTLI